MKMEHINKLDKTQIKKYKLWQVCKFDRRFNGIPKEKQENITNFKHVSAKKLKEYELKESGKVRLLSTGNYVGYTKYDKNDKNINFGEVITIPTGGTANIKYHKGYFIDSGNILISSDLLNLKYLYYFLTNNNDKIQSFYRGAGVQHPSMSDIIEMEIISPPMEVQNEIVEVLDKFSALETELEAELEARTKQYEYYKNKLLINDKFRKIKLSDIGPVKMCRRIFKNQTTDKGDIPFYKIGTFGVEADAYISRELFLEYKDKYPFPNKSDVLLSASGTIGRRVIYEGEDAYFQDSNIVWIDNDETIVLNKYLYYLYGIIDWKVSSGGTISRLYNKTILNTEVLVPPLDEQERIVSILDKFSSLVNDIKEGLPAEIELRRKQYEYYRNKLLTFE